MDDQKSFWMCLQKGFSKRYFAHQNYYIYIGGWVQKIVNLADIQYCINAEWHSELVGQKKRKNVLT